MSNLQILSNSIRTFENLYSLTDLHKVSGNEAKHKPVLFLSNQQTKDLISEIENDKVGNSTLAVKTVRGGKNPSTYACKEIVIAYAAWISPQFHLVVLRAFLNQLENSQKTEQTAPLALPNKGKISVELNHYLELAHLARTASSTCWHLMDTHKKALEAFGFAFSPINSLSIQAELVEKMQFVLDDVETNHRNYLKQQTF